jgi:DNA repair photolyase
MERAREAGATHAAYILLRLPGPVAGIFEKRLREALPLRAERVLSRLRDVRNGALNDPRFGSRMKGEGAYAESIRTLFERTARRLGYDVRKVEAPGTPGAPSPFRRPSSGSEEHGAQQRLF